MRFVRGFLSLCLPLSLALGGIIPSHAEAAGPTYPYNTQTANGVSFSISDVTNAWTTWKAARITTSGAGGGARLRVVSNIGDSTVSEGMAYGMLFASLFDDQATMDGLWLYTASYLDNQGLMHWKINANGSVAGDGQGAATDADVDMALALVNACTKVRKSTWPASPVGVDYCALATTLITRIYTYEVDRPGAGPLAGLNSNPGWELLPGSQWNTQNEYPQGIVNLSYFAPGYFTVFGQFTGKTSEWAAVNARNYAITNAVQATSGNCSKLVPNWNTYAGAPQYVPWQPEEYAWWSYDAARFAWRVAVDRAWFNTPNAIETMNEVGGFFSSVGLNNLRARYRLDGSSVDSYTNAFFLANAGSAIWAAPSPQAVSCGAATPSLKVTAQQAYNALVQKQPDDQYYHGAWRLLGMLLMTGNFPNLLSDTTPPPDPDPQPDPTTGGCQVKYNITSQWNVGFTTEITITNTGAAINNWTLGWSFPNGQRITDIWNASAVNNGPNASVQQGQWNAQIPTNGSVNFGFNASYSGTNGRPTSMTLNGRTCSVVQ